MSPEDKGKIIGGPERFKKRSKDNLEDPAPPPEDLSEEIKKLKRQLDDESAVRDELREKFSEASQRLDELREVAKNYRKGPHDIDALQDFEKQIKEQKNKTTILELDIAESNIRIKVLGQKITELTLMEEDEDSE